ncbi:MAG: hypothetical protein L0220_19245, partial [Acidobacteria bacterium]|nr:hypothetical protein [Acidobacteriota bacterium]
MRIFWPDSSFYRFVKRGLLSPELGGRIGYRTSPGVHFSRRPFHLVVGIHEDTFRLVFLPDAV